MSHATIDHFEINDEKRMYVPNAKIEKTISPWSTQCTACTRIVEQQHVDTTLANLHFRTENEISDLEKCGIRLIQ